MRRQTISRICSRQLRVASDVANDEPLPQAVTVWEAWDFVLAATFALVSAGAFALSLRPLCAWILTWK